MDPGLRSLKPVLLQFGFGISSEGRTAAHNAEVGGVSNSWHVHGRALDVVGGTPQRRQQLLNFINRSTPYEAIDEGDHIHIEPKG